MKERDLYPLVRDWLVARGFVIHVELFGHDVVAVRDGKVTVVELKTCLTYDLQDQCRAAGRWADFVYAAIGSKHRASHGLRSYGIGLLYVNVHTKKIREWMKPRPQPYAWHKARVHRLQRLDGRLPAQPHELAGLPSTPELRAQRDLRVTLGGAR